MSTYKNLELIIGDQARASKDDPYGICKVYATYEHVNNSANLLDGIYDFGIVRSLWVSTYGKIAARFCNIDTFTDFDIASALSVEMVPNDKLIMSGNVLVDRSNGVTKAVGMMGPDGITHYFKATKRSGKYIVAFKKHNFTKFFYAFADNRKGFHTDKRIDASVRNSAKKNEDHTIHLALRPMKGGTKVSASVN